MNEDIQPVMEDLIELGIEEIHPVDPCALDIEQIKKECGNI